MKTNASGLNVWQADGEDRDPVTLGKRLSKISQKNIVSLSATSESEETKRPYDSSDVTDHPIPSSKVRSEEWK